MKPLYLWELNPGICGKETLVSVGMKPWYLRNETLLSVGINPWYLLK